MKKFTKTLVFIFLALFIVAGALLGYVKFALPNVGPSPSLVVEPTQKRIERGRYLANHVTVCMDCHSTRDWTRFAGPYKPESLGAGGEKFSRELGFPGNFYAPNITPSHLGSWTDGEIFRAITSGVNKDGKALFPVMGYLNFGKMDREDIYSIITYIRTLPSKDTNPQASEADFPMNFIINTIPSKATLTQLPPENDQVAYGNYLVNAASCGDCHTRQEKGSPVAGMEFAGGFEFNLPSGITSSANITPDKKTGIGEWSKEQFVSRFKMFADSNYKAPAVGKKDFQTVMPWAMYAGMKKSDLEAVYAYLKTLKPIQNQVVRFKPSSPANSALSSNL
ncbi:MAG: cytochrome c-related protein [Sphingobacteriaceae bacterium]|jgi:mono/diheme cytochrome c family protein|nr:cytochrome c-related protein [Sphingobacteriaceae bacterium]